MNNLEQYLKEYISLCNKYNLHINGYELLCTEISDINKNISMIYAIDTCNYGEDSVIIDYTYK